MSISFPDLLQTNPSACLEQKGHGNHCRWSALAGVAEDEDAEDEDDEQ